MDILLSHTTALEALRTWGAQDLIGTGAASAPEVPEKVPLQAELLARIGDNDLLASLSRPLHLLATRTRGSRRTALVHEHLQSGPLPGGSVIRLAPGLCCVAAEELAVEMSLSLTLLELVILLSELMGLYAICPSCRKGMYQRERPLMTPESLLSHLDALGPRRGTRLVRRALAMACVRSGSPRETKLALRLSLKPSLGGYGLHVLSMNEPLEVRRIHDRMQRGVRRPDILVAGPERPGQVIGSAGPTTSGRMDAYSPRLLDLGQLVMIGKGKRNQAVKDAVVRNGGVYLAALGGAGALMATSVKELEVLCWEDLGCEAVRRLEVEDFPLTVILDAHGGDLYESGPAAYLASRDGQ